MDQTAILHRLHHTTFPEFQNYEEHQKFTKMDVHIVVELVFSSTFQISIQFILKVPKTQEWNELGFGYETLIPDFSSYG